MPDNDDDVGHSASNDPLSVSSTLIGLIATSTQATLSLGSLPAQNVRSAARSFKLSVQLLFKILRTLRTENRTPSAATVSARTTLVELDVLIVALTESVLAFSKLAETIDAIAREAAEFDVPLQHAFEGHRGTMDLCTGRIRAADKVLTKLLSVLQVGDDAEAARHYSQAKSLAISILSSSDDDNDLPSRLHLMGDTFHCLAHIPASRLAALKPAPPPGYSVRRPIDEEPPSYSDSRGEETTILAGLGTVFAGLTLDDVGSLALVRIPIEAREVTWGRFFADDYAARMDGPLGEALAAGGWKGKAETLVALLGVSELLPR
ncbi:hypothetical protein NLU13_8885 [Sarocladium strictum]|uniref:Fungal N-terminal domain-containing protein n=1 Tax=Sarocladium strictum TaxID=5046 RepID=A0AA39L3X2_SARSR|nr:hypothetical protein NLU13_8885 [Sarocladium strictum]